MVPFIQIDAGTFAHFYPYIGSVVDILYQFVLIYVPLFKNHKSVVMILPLQMGNVCI